MEFLRDVTYRAKRTQSFLAGLKAGYSFMIGSWCQGRPLPGNLLRNPLRNPLHAGLVKAAAKERRTNDFL